MDADVIKDVYASAENDVQAAADLLLNTQLMEGMQGG